MTAVHSRPQRSRAGLEHSPAVGALVRASADTILAVVGSGRPDGA